MWLNLHVVPARCRCCLRLCTVLNKIMGCTGWDVELSQPNHDDSITHICLVGCSSISSSSSIILSEAVSAQSVAPPQPAQDAGGCCCWRMQTKSLSTK